MIFCIFELKLWKLTLDEIKTWSFGGIYVIINLSLTARQTNSTLQHPCHITWRFDLLNFCFNRRLPLLISGVFHHIFLQQFIFPVEHALADAMCTAGPHCQLGDPVTWGVGWTQPRYLTTWQVASAKGTLLEYWCQAEGSSALLWSCVVRRLFRPSSLAFNIFNFSSKTAEQNWTKIDRKQDLHVLYQVWVFKADPKKKTRWPPWPLIGWDIYDFSSETTEQNSTKNWQEARSQRPLLNVSLRGLFGNYWDTGRKQTLKKVTCFIFCR